VIKHILDAIDYEGKDKNVIGKVDGTIIGRGAKFLK
jgi:hypothetical protein